MQSQYSWTNYWCAGGDRHYAAVDPQLTLPHWRFLAALESPVRVLDLACGNAAVAHQLAQLPLSTKLDYVGVDSADVVATGIDHKNLAVTVHPRVAVEELPFDDHSFDFVISQFGIEYGDIEVALDQALRCLKPGGQVVCLAHCERSMLQQRSRNNLAAMAMLKKSGYFQSVAALVEADLKGRKGKAARASVRTRKLKQELSAHPLFRMQSGNCLFEAIVAGIKVFEDRHQAGARNSLAQLQEFEQDVEAGMARTAQMLEAVISFDRIRQLKHRYADQGFTSADYRHEGALIGTTLALKPG